MNKINTTKQFSKIEKVVISQEKFALKEKMHDRKVELLLYYTSPRGISTYALKEIPWENR